MSKTKVILDVDTGVDDTMAIFYALGRPEIELVACTTVYGNTSVENATANTLAMLHLCGRDDIPVAQGVGRPLLRPFTSPAIEVHGENGLGGVVMPTPPNRPLNEHAVDLLIRMAHEHPGELSLLPVSPLTNIALAFSKDPSIAKLYKQVVIMGSNLTFPGILGIRSTNADPNFHNDPEAASIVMNSGANIILVGVDVTGLVRMNHDTMDWIRANGGKPAQKLMDITEYYYNFYINRKEVRPAHLPRGAGMHDPLAVAIAEDPTLATMEAIRGEIELTGEFTRGHLVPDRRLIEGQEPNLRICTDVKADEFMDRFCKAVVSL